MVLPPAKDDTPLNGAPDSPAEDFAVVSPSDTVALSFRARGLYIGVTGDVTVMARDGVTTVLFKAVPVGVLPIRCSYVMNTGTTATNIVALR